ncbi:hypothetical protein [Cohnella rhizosphaerae]|uniref:Uncharacterized protein n=1 Tax=Cohnella rhizosphaerae TaxID=1457232 RepID=A0A9X4L154_9BACL|nr:hypothetical protein [Cohnella rhizosphaerae]MDG0814623.1 hypothetical protein [Cohnella rhizosphaerae]
MTEPPLGQAADGLPGRSVEAGLRLEPGERLGGLRRYVAIGCLVFVCPHAAHARPADDIARLHMHGDAVDLSAGPVQVHGVDVRRVAPIPIAVVRVGQLVLGHIGGHPVVAHMRDRCIGSFAEIHSPVRRSIGQGDPLRLSPADRTGFALHSRRDRRQYLHEQEDKKADSRGDSPFG